MLYNSEGAVKSFRLHRLVIKSFKKVPDNFLELQVNHKDGNKDNNHVDNLEWVTAQENSIHAIDNNLTEFNINITLKNIETDEVLNFSSIRAVGGHLAIDSKVIQMYAARSKQYPFMGKYEFTITRHNYTKLKDSKDIYVHDFVNDTITKYSNYNTASLYTSVNHKAIIDGLQRVKHFYIAGYMFTYEDVKDPAIKTNKLIARGHRDTYYAKPYKKVDSGVDLYNYVTGETKSYNTLKEVSVHMGKPERELVEKVSKARRMKRPFIYYGYGVKPSSLDIPWIKPDNNLLIGNSLGIMKPAKLFLATLPDDSKKVVGIDEAAKLCGYGSLHFKTKVRRGELKTMAKNSSLLKDMDDVNDLELTEQLITLPDLP